MQRNKSSAILIVGTIFADQKEIEYHDHEEIRK
jgi:hypothetical protein